MQEKEQLLSITQKEVENIEKCAKDRLPICFNNVNLNSVLPRLYFGNEILDGIFQGFKPGQIVYLHGSEICLNLAEILCLKAQLSINEGGINSKVVFLDNSCSFNIENITDLSCQHKLDKSVIFQNILLSRSFTCFQLTNFIECKLEKILENTGSKFIVVSEFPLLYCDRDLEEDLGKDQFSRAFLGLKTTIKSKDAIALITYSGHEPTNRMNTFERHIKRLCDIAANVTVQDFTKRIILEKHLSIPIQVIIPEMVSIGLKSFLEVA